MGSLGTSNVRLPSPSFTYTKTLAKSPLETMMFSAWLVPLQPGSWLMSILAGFGAVPSNFTVPLTVATVAGSIGVAAGAACCSAVLLDCSSFLLHAASTSNAQRASRVTIVHFVFSVMMSLSLEFDNAVPASCRLWRGHHGPRSEQRMKSRFCGPFYREPPLPARCDSVAASLRLVGCCTAAFARGIDAATLRCSSAVNWKM